MKQKVLVISKIVFSILFICLISSCENFMAGSLVKKELEEMIEDATAEQFSISVFAYNSHGTLTGETGGVYKIGSKNHSLKFIENDGFQFVEWVVFDSDSKKISCNADDNLFIENPFEKNTSFSVNGSANGYKIEAVCKPRPKIESVSPNNLPGGVNWDSDIIVYFAQPVSKNSFVFTNEELAAYGKLATPVFANAQTKSGDITGINLAGMRFFKNIEIVDSTGKSLNHHFNTPVLSDDGKKVTLSVNENNLFDFSTEVTKEINVIVKSDVNYEYVLQDGSVTKVLCALEDYKYNYRITASTTGKAKLNFVNKNSDDVIVGTMNYNGPQEINIGQTIKVEFVPYEDFLFINWDVTNTDALDLKISGNDLFITVVKEVKDIVVQPVCQAKGVATFIVKTNVGNVSPVGSQTVRVGETVTLSYSGDSDYYFPGWVVVKSSVDEVLNREEAYEYFECEDWSKNTVEILVKKECSSFEIVANSYLRPHVFNHEPENKEEGVTKDSNIKVYFDTEIDESTLYFTVDEEYKIKTQDPIVKFESDEKGKYAYTLSDGQFYYKNLTIENRATGENLSKYYGKPYLLEDKKTMIIPSNKVKDSSEKLIEDKLPPGGILIFVKLGTDYGFYADDNLIPLARDTNLTWIYSTKNAIDEQVPTKKSFTVTGNNGTTSINLHNQTTDAIYESYLKGRYLKNNKLTINLELEDLSRNLSEIYLNYTYCHDENYNTLQDQETKKVALDFEKDGTKFTVKNKVIDLKELAGRDGNYKLSVVAIDDSGNKWDSGKFFACIDQTAPKPINKTDIRLFKKYKKAKISWKIPGKLNAKDFKGYYDLERIELWIDGSKVQSITPDNSSSKVVETEKDLVKAGKYKFISYDFFGNEAESEEYDYDLDIPYGSILYSDQWTLDWWNYDDCNYTDYAVNGVLAVGHVGYNMDNPSKNFSVNDRSIKIFNISAGDYDSRTNYSGLNAKKTAENNKLDSSFKTTHKINFGVPGTSDYEAIFGNEELFLKNYNLMQNSLNFLISDNYYWLNEFAGSVVNPATNSSYIDSYRTVYASTYRNKLNLASNPITATLPYRLISDFSF